MSDSKHTPGPWKVVIDRDADHNANRVEIQADDAGSCTIAVVEVENGPHAVALADARLIAAAPELLESLAALAGVRLTGKYGQCESCGCSIAAGYCGCAPAGTVEYQRRGVALALLARIVGEG